MWVFVVTFVLILGIVALIAGVVLLGMEGQYRDRAPVLAKRLAQIAQHFNGDGELPPEVTARIEKRLSSRSSGETKHPFRVGAP
ncbi:hypothetical protein [Enemella sp. A6]|uniref:hypothetical protein n=1 Tax=Enemella sp. A6 TaxID=3440152 RepID=UPI003EBA016E